MSNIFQPDIRKELEKEYQSLVEKRFYETSYFNLKIADFEEHLASTGDLKLCYEYFCTVWSLNIRDRRNFHFGSTMLERLHSDEAFTYFFDQADINTKLKGTVAYMAAFALIRNRKKELCDRLSATCRELIRSGSDIDREHAAIVLGWFGNKDDLLLLTNTMLSDSYPYCRAWCATALEQLSFHGVDKGTVIASAAPAVLQAIKQETDLFALGCMILTAQEFYGKKWLSGTAVEERRKEKILKSQKTAINVLTKLLG